MKQTKKTQSKNDASEVRLDKWLWAARFYKTRGLAREMIQSGKIKYNGQRCKASKSVELAALISMQAGFDTKEVEVLKLSDQRRGAPEAQLLYQETEQSKITRELRAQERKSLANVNPHPDTKPDKKQRRQLINVKNQFPHD